MCLSWCDKPQPIIHPLQHVRWGGEKKKETQTHLTLLFSPLCYLSLFLVVFLVFFSFLPQAYPGFHPLLTNTHFIFSFFFPPSLSCSARRPDHFSRGAPTSLKLWWIALAPVSISKPKQFGDKTSCSLSYRFSPEFGFKVTPRVWMNTWTKAPMNAWGLPDMPGQRGEGQSDTRPPDRLSSKFFFTWEFHGVAQICVMAVEPPLEIHVHRYCSMRDGGIVQVVLCCNILFTSEWGWKATSTLYTEDAFCLVHARLSLTLLRVCNPYSCFISWAAAGAPGFCAAAGWSAGWLGCSQAYFCLWAYTSEGWWNPGITEDDGGRSGFSFKPG